jgi:hypothetical protein
LDIETNCRNNREAISSKFPSLSRLESIEVLGMELSKA